MRAVVVREAGAGPEIAGVLPAEAGRRGVRVQIAAAGVCHSDLSMTDGTLRAPYPLVLGHEASGTVIDAGPEVTRVAPGDHVVLNWAPACRACWFCLHGEPWLCRATEGVTARPAGRLADGTPVHACLGVGAFAEEIVVPERAVVPLPGGIAPDVAALLGCAVLTGVGAAWRTAGVRAGESVVVIGLGGVGLSAVAGAALAGAGPVIAVDSATGKEPLARAMGATCFLAAGEDLPARVRALTGGRGADHALECVGTAATIRAAWRCLRRGGRCTIVGVGGADQQVSFAAIELFHFARTLTASVYGSSDPDRDLPALAEHVRSGRLDLRPLVSHRIGLGEVGEAFARMRSGTGARSLIVLGESPAG